MSDTAASMINERAAEEYYRKGLEAEEQGLHEKSVDFYERALGENPDHEKACFRLAVLYDRQADDAKAIELYERLCTSPPVALNALVNLAILYEDNNHYEEARRCLRAVLDTDPNHARARLYLKDVESASSMYIEEESRDERSRSILDAAVTDFELSVRSRNCLKKMNIKTIGDLLRVSEAELLAFKNFGETSLTEIKSLLAKKGLRLGNVPEDQRLAPKRRLPPNLDNVPPEILNKSVADLELSVRSRKALQRLNITTLGELAGRTEAELLGCKNFGQTSLNEIKQQLTAFGLNLRKLED
jgi:DNA-directed RNA polymerase subunit alpha